MGLARITRRFAVIVLLVCGHDVLEFGMRVVNRSRGLIAMAGGLLAIRVAAAAGGAGPPATWFAPPPGRAERRGGALGKRGSPWGEVREGAGIRWSVYPPVFFPALESAADRKDLSPDVTGRLKVIVGRVRPWVAPRLR